MLDYRLTPCPQQIIKKLDVKKVNILPKHRYIYIKGNKRFTNRITNSFKLQSIPYPKKQNNNYDIGTAKQLQTIVTF